MRLTPMDWRAWTRRVYGVTVAAALLGLAAWDVLADVHAGSVATESRITFDLRNHPLAVFLAGTAVGGLVIHFFGLVQTTASGDNRYRDALAWYADPAVYAPHAGEPPLVLADAGRLAADALANA